MPTNPLIVAPLESPLDHVLPDRRIRAHYRELGGAPGAETSGLEPAGTGQRIR